MGPTFGDLIVGNSDYNDQLMGVKKRKSYKLTWTVFLFGSCYSFNKKRIEFRWQRYDKYGGWLEIYSD